MDASIQAAALAAAIRSDQPPLVIDVRRNERFREARDLIRGALRRDPLRVADWGKTLPPASSVIVYCVHGHEVSRSAASALAGAGLNATYLEGGIEGWRESGGGLAGKPAGASTRSGDARAAEDRPHRLPLAAPPLRRPGGGVPLRADAGREACGQ